MILKDFQNKKKLLLNTFDELAKFGFIPYKFEDIEYSKELIDKHKQNLEDERFFISICGAIKSGKSTLLNRWLFNGKDILPTDDSVCTATLSKIQYSNKQYAKVFFYNKEEWRKLKKIKINEDSLEKRIISKNLPKNDVNYFEKYLQPEIDKSAKKGIYAESAIKEKRLIKSVHNFDDLKEYSAKDGKYTPFVKYIEIFINNKDIKEVTIVDTPGTNDPNILRENITKEWIDQSSAVIMLMYGGQAFTKPDLDFINKNLSSIPHDKIIFSISKSDSIGNYENVKNYVEENLRNNKDIKDRHLLKNNKEVYPISTIASIIKMKKNNNIELTDDEKAILDNAESIDEFIENDGYLPEFYKAIGNYLMKDKGEAILEKAKQEIITICQNRINKLNYDIEISSIKNENIGKNEKEINKKIQQIEEIRDKIENLKKISKIKIGDVSVEIKNYLDIKLKSLRKEIKKKYNKWLDVNKVNTIITLSESELYNFFEDILIDNFDELLDKNLESKLQDTYNNFKIEMKNVTKEIISWRMEYLFMPTLELDPLFKEAKRIFQRKLSSEIMKGFRKKVWGFLWTMQKQTKENILKEVDDILKLTQDEISADVKNELKIHNENNTTIIIKRVNDMLNELSEQLKKLRIKIPDIQKEKNIIEKDIQKMETLKKEFDDRFIKIKKQMEEL